MTEPTIEPTWHLAWPETDGVRSVAISPDDRFAYVHTSEVVIDVWRVIVDQWRISAAVPLGMVGVLALVWMLRVVRRPRRVGAPHCARCNYDLSALGSLGACPECGLSLSVRRPRIGRSRFRRLAVPGSMLLLAGATYGSLFLVSAAGWGEIADIAFWPSQRMMRWASVSKSPWLWNARAGMDTILEVDLRTGRTMRTLLIAPESPARVCLSPDGHSLFRSDRKHWNRVTRVDVRTGKRHSFAEFPGVTPGYFRSPSVVGFSQDGGDAYVQWIRENDGVNGVSAWHLADGAVKTLVTTKGYQPGPGWPPLSRRFLRLPGTAGTAFVSLPSMMQTPAERQTVVQLHRIGEPPIELTVPGEYMAGNVPAVSRAGDAMYIVSGGQIEITVFDPRSGEDLGSFRPPLGIHSFGRELAMSGDGRRLMAPAGRDSVLVRDISTREWIAGLSVPDELYGPQVSVSPSGRWVAAVCQKDRPAATGARAKSTHDLVIWDLGSLEHPKP